MKRAAPIILVLLSSCAGIWGSIKSSAWPAGGAAGGALAGSAMGPVGTVGGAAVGAVVGHAVDENAQLRSGELQGSGALDRDVERWKRRATAAEGAQSILQKSWDAVVSVLLAAAASVLLWFVWRNRANIKELGVRKGLWHGVVGGAKT